MLLHDRRLCVLGVSWAKLSILLRRDKIIYVIPRFVLESLRSTVLTQHDEHGRSCVSPSGWLLIQWWIHLQSVMSNTNRNWYRHIAEYKTLHKYHSSQRYMCIRSTILRAVIWYISIFSDFFVWKCVTHFMLFNMTFKAVHYAHIFMHKWYP